jgi:peptidoglycan/xylan/chitin deacetylase (PgdA/CDA1 family)
VAITREPKGLRVNYLIIFLSGLVLLAAAILIFMLVVKNVYGNYELSEILPSRENLNVLTWDKQKKVAILYSNYTENMLPEGSTWISDNIDTWETFIKASRMNYDLISDQIIELGEHFEYPVIILPAAKSMSDKQLIQLKKYLENGGSIFVTSGIATYSDEAKWRGWEFFTETFGMNFYKEIHPRDFERKVHTLRGNLPLTAGIPTGYSLKIATWDRPIYAEVLEPRTTQVSFWYDYTREAGLVMEEIKKSAGIAYGTYGKGRFVWFGFELNSVLGEQEDYIYFEKLFNNSMSWLTYRPTAYIKDWPATYDAAMILVPIINEQPANINNILPIVNRYKLPASVFVHPQTALNYPSLIKSLSGKVDIGPIVDVGFLESPFDTINALYDRELQFANMGIAKDTLESISGSTVKGLMPQYGYYDDNTVLGMSRYGYDYLVTDSLTDRSVPKIVFRNEKPILIITKTARDDYEIIEEYGLTNRDFQIYTYEEDINRLLFEGGLYVLKLHTEYQLQPQYVDVLNDIVKYAKDNNIWLASVDDILTWWKRRGNIEVRYEWRSKRRISVEVTNPSDKIVEEFVAEVNINKPVRNVSISSEIINTDIPEYEFDQGANAIYMYVKNLKPNETRIFLIDFENELPL